MEKHIIWTSEINVDDYAEEIREYCGGEVDEDDIYRIAHEWNTYSIDDERVNLNINVGSGILAVADIGRWNGRRSGYKEIDSGNISDCLYTDCDGAEWYIDEYGELCGKMWHHDGTNYVTYRKWLDGVSESAREKLLDAIYNDGDYSDLLERFTERLGDYVAKVYGWKLPDVGNGDTVNAAAGG